MDRSDRRSSTRPTCGARVTAVFASGAVALVLVGYGAARADDGSTTSRGWEASSRRLEAQADAYIAVQANIERGRAADSARLQAAADASGR